MNDKKTLIENFSEDDYNTYIYFKNKINTVGINFYVRDKLDKALRNIEEKYEFKN